MLKVPKISLHIFAVSQEKHGLWNWFLPADKHKNFLQIDSITLGVHGQGCQKHPKQQPFNIFVISQGKCKGWSWFFPAYNSKTFLQSDTVIFYVCGQTCPNYPKLSLLAFGLLYIHIYIYIYIFIFIYYLIYIYLRQKNW